MSFEHVFRYYCLQGAKQRTPPNEAGVGGICVAGQNCPLGTSNPVMCPGGRYCIDTSGAITGKCRAGFYCRQGASSPNPSPPSNTNINGLIGDMCTAGHYCLEGERHEL